MGTRPNNHRKENGSVIMIAEVEDANQVKESTQCDWLCPKCGSQCGSVSGHKGIHQCPIHYKKVYFCKECYVGSNKTYPTKEALLEGHPTLKKYPELIGEMEVT